MQNTPRHLHRPLTESKGAKDVGWLWLWLWRRQTAKHCRMLTCVPVSSKSNDDISTLVNLQTPHTGLADSRVSLRKRGRMHTSGFFPLRRRIQWTRIASCASSPRTRLRKHANYSIHLPNRTAVRSTFRGKITKGGEFMAASLCDTRS